MENVEKQNEALEALKFINAAINNLRLYSEKDPQVTNAVEKAYQGTKLYLRKHHSLWFSLQDGDAEPLFFGRKVSNTIRERLKFLKILDFLRKLGLKNIVLNAGIDRRTFKKILSVFTATPEQIKNAGGGKAYAVNLGLEDVFPDTYVEPDKAVVSEAPQKKPETRIPEVRREYLLYLFNQRQDIGVQEELRRIFMVKDKAVIIMVTAIRRLLQEMQKENTFAVLAVFGKLMENADALIAEGKKQIIAEQTAGLLAKGLKAPALCVLLAQSFPTKFGAELYELIVARIDPAVFSHLIGLLGEPTDKDAAGDQSVALQKQILTDTCIRLLETPRGKQYLAREKAQLILRQAEEDRQTQRVRSGLNLLLQGDLSRLKNDEVLFNLPTTIEKLLLNKKDVTAAEIIKKIAGGLGKSDEEISSRLAQCLSLIAEKLVVLKRYDWLKKLTPVFLGWLVRSDVIDATYKRFIVVLQTIVSDAWNANEIERADEILKIFHTIRTGKLQKNELAIKIVAAVQDKAIDPERVAMFLQQFLKDPGDEVLYRRVIMHGAGAGPVLLNVLLASEERGDRIRILKMLSEMEAKLADVLVVRLSDSMPWYGKRNIIRLLTEQGSEKDIAVVEPYLVHDDLRVQREALLCVYRLSSGSNRRDILLKALSQVSDNLKESVIRGLQPFVSDPDVVTVLVLLLADQEDFSDDIRKSLLLQICFSLGESGSVVASGALNDIARIKGARGKGKIDRDIRRSIDAALMRIKAVQLGKKQKKADVGSENSEGGDEGAVASKTVVKELDLTEDLAVDRQVEKLLGQRKEEEAKAVILDVIARESRKNNFDRAEVLREQLIALDSTVLTEIVQAGDSIEQARNDAIDMEHLDIWTDLYDRLTTDEFNTLYYSMERKIFSVEESVVSQGDILDRLFFINSGRVKLSYSKNGRETLVKILTPGTVVGGGSFFDASVWTIDMTCLSTTEFSILDRAQLEKWQEKHPGLESRLQEYCLQFDNLKDFFVKSGSDRREYERVFVNGKADNIILDEYGEETKGQIKGELVDISASGVSFFVHLALGQNARMLLGRKISLSLNIGEEKGKKVSGQVGEILAVCSQNAQASEYSVHVHFENLISDEVLDHIVKQASSEL